MQRPASAQDIETAAYYYVVDVSWHGSSADIPVARRLDLGNAYHWRKDYKLEVIGKNLLDDFEDYEPESIHDQVLYLRLSGGF